MIFYFDVLTNSIVMVLFLASMMFLLQTLKLKNNFGYGCVLVFSHVKSGTTNNHRNVSSDIYL